MTVIGSSQALIQKIQTTTDGGLRITLDLPACDVCLVTELMSRQAHGRPLVTVQFDEPSSGLSLPDLGDLPDSFEDEEEAPGS